MLLDFFRKTANMGLKLVAGLKYEVKSSVRALEKEGLLSKRQAENLAKRLLNEVNMERKAFQKFMTVEINKELKKAKKVVKSGAKKFSSAVKNCHKKVKKTQRRVKKRGKK